MLRINRCGRLHRGLVNRARLRIALGIFLVFLLCYKFLPRVLLKVPATSIRHRDADFHSTNEKEIIVLMWTAMWRQYENANLLNADKCPHLENGTIQQSGSSNVFDIPCRISYDRRYLSVSHALVFHSFDLMLEEVPRARNPNQLWVYLQQESPIYTKLNLQAYSNVFNWTMTYRQDSDVYHPYGHFAPVSQQKHSDDVNQSISALVKSRKRLVAWIVSSCDSQSKREYFVQELQKYITVDVLGWCGQDCPSISGDCYSHIRSTHKFYLSFENSLCTDYITEKFFSALKADLVPVVYGGGKSLDYSAIAPKDSYIDARSFNSPKDLATYLLYLDKNDDEYLKYFAWKSKYQFVSSSLGWCNLCQKVYEHVSRDPPPARKWYRDLWKWWNYMSYDTKVEVDEQVARLVQGNSISQSYYYKMGAPACLSPPNKLVGSKTKPDFEPGLLNGRIFRKLWGWAKNEIF